MRLAVLLVVPLLLLAGCSEAPEPAATERPAGQNSETMEIPMDGFYKPAFGGAVPVRVEVEFTVDEGGPIDVFLATGEACAQFGARGFNASAEAFAAKQGLLEARLPAGDHCLILDNAGFAAGAAKPTGPVTVTYRIRVWETPTA